MSCRELVDQLFVEAYGDMKLFKKTLNKAGIPISMLLLQSVFAPFSTNMELRTTAFVLPIM